MHRPSHHRLVSRGFTLVEAIVIIVILGIIAAVIAPRFFGRIGQAERSVAMQNASALATAVDGLLLDHGLDENSTMRDLWEPPSGVDEDAYGGPYIRSEDQLVDPWGNEYVLLVPGDKNVDFDVISYGKDGAPGGEGEDEDIVKP